YLGAGRLLGAGSKEAGFSPSVRSFLADEGSGYGMSSEGGSGAPLSRAWIPGPWDDASAPASNGAGPYVPDPILQHIGGAHGQAAEQILRPYLKAGVNFEAQQLAEIGLSKNTTVWRPSLEQTESAAFKVIVGKPKYTSSGSLRGTTLDSTDAGFVEI